MSSKNIILNICLVTLTFVVGIIAIYLLSMSLYILKYRDDNYYLIDKDKIPTIYKVNGKRNLYYYKTSNKKYYKEKTYKYKNITDVKADLTNYIDELKNKYNYTYTSDIDLSDPKGNVQLSNTSIDNNMIIIIDIIYTDNSYTIKITKGKGNINYYK